MIRRSVEISTPCYYPPFLHPVQCDWHERQNQRIKLQHAIRTIPYEIMQTVYTIRENRKREQWTKRILLQNHIPIELFDHLRDYIYVCNRTELQWLPTKGYSRAIHHLIRTECIDPTKIERALAMGKIHDNLRQYNAHYFLEQLIHYIKPESEPFFIEIYEAWT